MSDFYVNTERIFIDLMNLIYPQNLSTNEIDSSLFPNKKRKSIAGAVSDRLRQLLSLATISIPSNFAIGVGQEMP
jgi:hypothetical protein